MTEVLVCSRRLGERKGDGSPPLPRRSKFSQAGGWEEREKKKEKGKCFPRIFPALKIIRKSKNEVLNK